MSRPRKDNKALNIRLDSKIYQKLEQHSFDEKRTKTAIVEIALEEYFHNHAEKGNK